MLRSIPACAGEPPIGVGHSPVRHGDGLSPRVRGNHRVSSTLEFLYSNGSIPACAGEPYLLAGWE